MKNYECAFPVLERRSGSDGADLGLDCLSTGLSAQKYAAIHLKVPRSGDEDIDRMVRESRRADFAGQALEGMLFAESNSFPWPPHKLAERAFELADAMLEAWEKEAGK
jgi:hypothetical protein